MDTPAQPGNALNAYQAILQQNGYGRADINKHSHFARLLIAQLRDEEIDNQNFREAVERVIDTLPDEASISLCQFVARHFFPFLVGDMQAISMLSQTGAFDRDQPTVTLPPHKNLDDLIKTVSAMQLDESEHLAMSDYSYALQTQEFTPTAIQNRSTIALLLLVGMRGLPRDGKHYRAVADRLLTLFSQERTRDYFLSVAREFYGFMVGNPNALVALTQDYTLMGKTVVGN